MATLFVACPKKGIPHNLRDVFFQARAMYAHHYQATPIVATPAVWFALWVSFRHRVS